MICDNCKENEAIISYTKMIGNEVEEVHLCAKCAEIKMRKDLVFNNIVNDKVESFLKELFKLSGKSQDGINKKSCSVCGTNFKDLEKNSLGCEHCYEEFKEEIESMILSFKSSSKHRGKIPISAGKEAFIKREKEELINKLSVAIELEEYEEAALIRDKIKELKKFNEHNKI
ncbi:MAG: UvrB/UvrC motif-containing protein [Peptoniphilaceae bacterium]